MAKTSEMIITDNLDLTEKHKMTKDEFYSQYKGQRTPFNAVDSLEIEQNNEKMYYALVTTSGKEINSRLYDDSSWAKTVVDKMWLLPYSKPILYNHNLYDSIPEGRIMNAFLISHSSKSVIQQSLPNEELPQEVIDYYNEIKAFDEGISSIIVNFQPSKFLAHRLDNKLDLTVSQSSYMNQATCNICGQSYYGSSCTHIAGNTYSIEEDGATTTKKCIVTTYDFDPIELSFVNLPANDTSVVYIYEKKDTETNSDAGTEPLNVIDKNTNETEKGGEENNMNEDYKEILKKVVLDSLKVSEEEKQKIETFYDSLNPEQVKNFLEITKNLKKDSAEEQPTEEPTTENNPTGEQTEGEPSGEAKTKDNKENENAEGVTENQSTATNENVQKDSQEKPIEKFFNNEEIKPKTADYSDEILAIIEGMK